MAMRSKFFVVAFCVFLIFSVDPVAAARVQTNHESLDSGSNKDVVQLEEQWFARGDRCVRLQNNFNTAVSRVRAKSQRASRYPGIVSSASLVMTLRRMNRNFKLAAQRECSWITEKDADTDTMLSVARENLNGNPCLPQVQAMMGEVNQSDAEELSMMAVQAVQMLISGNCTTVEFPTEETSEQPVIQTETMEEISEDVLDDVADAALDAEEEEVDGSVLVEQDVSLEQKPHVVVVHPGQQVAVAHPVPAPAPRPAADVQPQHQSSWAVEAVVGIGLFILSIGLLCAAGPAIMAVISLIFISVIVLFLAFFYTFIAVTLQANPATGNAWLSSYLYSTWTWTTQAFGGQLTNGAHWAECFRYLR